MENIEMTLDITALPCIRTHEAGCDIEKGEKCSCPCYHDHIEREEYTRVWAKSGSWMDSYT